MVRRENLVLESANLSSFDSFKLFFTVKIVDMNASNSDSNEKSLSQMRECVIGKIDSKVKINNKLIDHKLDLISSGNYQLNFLPIRSGSYQIYFYKEGKIIEGKIPFSSLVR